MFLNNKLQQFRLLLMTFKTGDLASLTHLYRETFQQTVGLDSGSPQYAFDTLMLPWIPYVSNCYGFDSYIYWPQLLEDDVECKITDYSLSLDPSRSLYPNLPRIDQIRPVQAFDVIDFSTAIADSCARSIKCFYEEQLTVLTPLPRWMEVDSGGSLFQLLQVPVSFRQFQSYYDTLTAYLTEPAGTAGIFEDIISIGPDALLEVYVNRDAALVEMRGGCTVQCFPRMVQMDILYYQVSKTRKKILLIEFIYSEFDRDKSNGFYNFEITYTPLDWLNLIWKFAYPTELYLTFFIVVGIVLNIAIGVFWYANRVLGQIKNGNLPTFDWLQSIALLIPNISAGFTIAMVPLFFILFFIYVLFYGWKLRYAASWPGTDFLLDVIQSDFVLVAADPTLIAATRRGRVGTAYFLFGFMVMYVGSLILVPKNISRREKLLEEKRDNREIARNVWSPTSWKRIQLIFLASLLLLWFCGMVDFSFAYFYGAQMLNIVMAYTVVAIFVALIIDNSLHDALLGESINIVQAMTEGMATLGAIDFRDFVLGYFIGSAMGLAIGTYVAPLLDLIISTLVETIDTVSKTVLEALKPKKALTLEDELEAEEKRAAEASGGGEVGETKKQTWYEYMGVADIKERLMLILPSAITGARTSANDEPKASEPEKKKKRSVKVPKKVRKRRFRRRVKTPGEPSGGVEEVIGFLQGYISGGIVVWHSIIVIAILILFREDVGLFKAYGIKVTDSTYYLLFNIFILPFQFTSDMLVNSSYESFWGYKFTEYLVYAKYRFMKRETRWKGMDTSLDECIGDDLRTVDQSCMSSQLAFEMFFFSQGLFFCLIGLTILINVQYNFFSDPVTAFLVPICVVAMLIICRVCLIVADMVGLWQIPDKGTGWHSTLGDGQDDKFGIPDPADIENLKRIAEMASPENYIMNQKLTQETFRYKFMDFNRLWLVEKLPTVFTPRTLRRSRPYLVKQLAMILGVRPPGEGLDEDDVQKIVTEPDESEFPPVKLNPSQQNIIRDWLSSARMRIKMLNAIKVYEVRAKRPQCELCGSGNGLEVDLMIPNGALCERYSTVNWRDRVLDVSKWKSFYIQNQRFRTSCHACAERRKMQAAAPPKPIEEREDGDVEAELRAEEETRKRGPLAGRGDPRLGPVFLSDSAKRLAQSWVDKARRSRGEVRARRDPLQELQEEVNDAIRLGLDPPRFASVRVSQNAASRAITNKWLQLARFKLTTFGVRVQDLAPIEGRAAADEARLRAERREAQIKADADAAIASAERERLQEEATARAQLNARTGGPLPPRPHAPVGPLPPRPSLARPSRPL
jgi:hypothetical protein